VALVPERLVNFRCYGGTGALEFLGMTDVELPKFDAMTEKIMGAGIAGEYDSPVLGHFGSQTAKLKWRTMTPAASGLLAPVQHALSIRGSIQIQDPMLGVLLTQAIVVEVRGQMKTFGPGKLEPGKPMETESEIECAVVRISIAGVPVVELDKFNFRYVVNGVDYLAGPRVDMGGV
jgi:P2 family phage contractile tail tube protein